MKTFKRILPVWIELHERIVQAQTNIDLQWWAGMYALQAACENNAVWMRAMDLCYVPSINALNDGHYIAHYSVDHKFDKRNWPAIDVSSFPQPSETSASATPCGWSDSGTTPSSGPASYRAASSSASASHVRSWRVRAC